MQKVEFIGRAPARLDVMGGIADYSGSMVLEMPLAIYTEARIRKRKDFMVNVISGDLKAALNFEVLLTDRPQIIAKQAWGKIDLPEWSLYVLGCIFVLLDERQFDFVGLDIEISSDIPIGSGLSSSAALEVSVLRALYKAFGLTPEHEKLALMAQRAENMVVGAPCGIMDQMTVHLGMQGNLLPIKCQPYEVQSPIPLQKGVSFYGFNTGVKHQVSGDNYSKVRTAAFMGLTIINKSQDLDYLCNLTASEFREKFRDHLPYEITGKDFLSRYGVVADALSKVKEEQVYLIKKCSEFPIFENERVHDLISIYTSPNIDKEKLGKIMFTAHQGYVDCGLSCPEADYIVDLVKSLGANYGLYGARITGGGSGGTVCICADSEQSIEIIQDKYFAEFGFRSMLYKTRMEQ